MQTRELTYDDKITRQFVAASVVWGLVGMLVGLLIALQLAWWPANVAPWLSFGRLRPLHTNAVIFAFVGNSIFAGVYYSSQRLLRATLPSKLLSQFHFWGWQLIIVAAAITLPLGYTQGKEYAELEWPLDIALALVWVAFAVNFFWLLARRRERQLYVALWFYIATIVTITVLHVVNGLVIPVSFLKSYSVFGGVQDALVQWWYGHNAVAFFLTTPVLGIMYYFVPKAANRPVYSYRLSIIHFWALVFLYIWAGPHHLLNTALPDWAQTLGMVFSLMLWAPSWGGMLNGLFTIRGAWDQLRRDPVLKFFAAALTFYGMTTFEGPLLSIKSVSGLAHYTDWIIAHVHGGALGWNGFMAAGMFYWLVPRLYGTTLHSTKAANLHFYLGTVGILLYILSMWTAGITQGLMWKASKPGGGLLYPDFIETFLALAPLYWTRLFGGLLYIVGFVIMAWNLVATAKKGKAVDGTFTVVDDGQDRTPPTPGRHLVFSMPVGTVIVVLLLMGAMGVVSGTAAVLLASLAFVIGFGATLITQLAADPSKPGWHQLLEGRALWFSVFTIVAVLVGGVAEILPMVIAGPKALRGGTTQPYTALELEGRDVYLKEGCYNCHSQMIRPFTWEFDRFGEPSRPEESAFDHPFQWGSRRIGPDLARVGMRYDALWQVQHLMDPRALVNGSNMPPFDHLKDSVIDFSETHRKLRAMRSVGVPYTPAEIADAATSARAQADAIVAQLAKSSFEARPDTELIALTAYLLRLGNPPAAEAPAPAPGSAAPDAAPGAAAPATSSPTPEVR